MTDEGDWDGGVALLLGLGWDTPGGLNRYLRDLAGALTDAGARPQVLVLGPASDVPAGVRVVAEESSPLPWRLLRYAAAVRTGARGVDVVDAHFALFAALPVLTGGLHGRPLVVHFQGPWAAESLAAGERADARVKAKRAIERLVYRRAERLIVLSDAFARILVDDYGIDRARIEVVPPGVDLQRFTPDRVGARARLDLGFAPVVFTARRLVPRMGLDVLLEAWARRSPAPGAVLLIAGEGPARADLEAQASALGLGPRVRFLGRVAEDVLRDSYRAADLCVLPSLALEGFGLAALEALACGVPVIVTDVGGLPDVVAGLDPSLVVRRGDPDALAERMRSALAGDAPSARRCREHAETFTWSRAAAEHERIYRAAARDGGSSIGAGGGPNGAPAAEPKRLKVTYLDHCALMSGGEIALLRLIDGLDVDATVILGQDGPLAEVLRSTGAAVEVRAMAESARGVSRSAVGLNTLPLRTALQTAGYVVSTARRLRRDRPDVVHTNSLKAALYGGLAGRLAGVPVVWHARDRIAPDYLPAPAVRLVRVLARILPSAVVANSRETLDTLHLPRRWTTSSPRAASAARTARAVVLPDPYRPDRAPVSRADRACTGLRVGMVGRLAPWKGQHVFLAAFAKARPTGADRAVVIGSAMFDEDDYAASLHELVAELGIADRVEFTGFTADVEAALGELDVLVHASVVAEPFGQVIVEGMAAGLPVIAADAGGPAEIITPDVDGLLYRPGSVDELAGALERVLNDADLRARLSKAAFARAEDFDPALIAPGFLDLYRSVIR